MENFPGIDVFRAWLEAHASSVVGRTCSAGLCPLAAFLNETWGGQWCVGVSSYRNGPLEVLDGLPEWARAFVWGLDSGYGIERDVTGQQALGVLQRIEETGGEW